MKTYNFNDLSKETQLKVIEGHTEYLDLTGNHEHSYNEVMENITLINYKFDGEGNIVKE